MFHPFDDVPNCAAAIPLLLRRTPVRSVILISTCDVYKRTILVYLRCKTSSTVEQRKGEMHFPLNRPADYIGDPVNLSLTKGILPKHFSHLAKRVALNICAVRTPALISPPGIIISPFHFTAVVVTGES